MANKIFISYKYWDDSVYQNPFYDKINNPRFPNTPMFAKVTPRSYVNQLNTVLSDYAIQKWENDDEDLSKFKDSTIASKLRDKIYDSSVTIVLISPHMKDDQKEEIDQWIPWEISYSLREYSRNDRTSRTNGIIAVILPDANLSYSYFVEYLQYCDCDLLKIHTPSLFTIIEKNFFNKKNPNISWCQRCFNYHYKGLDSHYFVYATWNDFIKSPKKYINTALDRREHIDEYIIYK